MHWIPSKDGVLNKSKVNFTSYSESKSNFTKDKPLHEEENNIFILINIKMESKMGNFISI